MLTISFPINLTQDDIELIRQMQSVQSSMVRCVYKMSENGATEKEMRIKLNDRFSGELDSWFKQSAVYSGRGMFAQDKSRQIPSRIFGGKNNFIARSKRKITNEEWKECRLLPLYIIGESPQSGNRKFVFTSDTIIFKPFKGRRIQIPIPNLRKNYQKKWDRIVDLANRKLKPITVSITSTKIFLTFDDSVEGTFKNPIHTRYAGIDMNPNYVGVSVFDSGKLISTKMFDLKDLTGKNKSEAKIKYETTEIGHSVGKYLKHLQVTDVFIEELNFKSGNSGKGKNFNRLTKNQWKRTAFTNSLGKYFNIQKVNAAYSSTIGNVLNTTLPDPIAASCEIARRAYECFKIKSKQFYPPLPTQGYLEDRWKKTDLPVFKTWKELHDFLKNSKLKYRVPIPDRMVFRILRSEKSRVFVLDNFSYK